jgi:hypothetical protein
MSDVANLEAENAALQAQVNSLQRQLFAHGIRPVGWKDPFEPEDYAALLAAVQSRYPILIPKFDTGLRAAPLAHQQQDFEKQFAAAMRFLFQARRSNDDKLATGYAASYWCDAASEHTRVGISLKAFCSAAVAVGDVAYARFANYPYDLAFGLSLGARAEHADVAAGWKRVLAGQFLDPTPLPNAVQMMGGRDIETAVTGGRDALNPNAWWRT